MLMNASMTVQAIHSHLEGSITALERTAIQCSESIEQAAQLVIDCFMSGGKLLICGNGGSAAESQHMAAELPHRLSAKVIRRALPAIALTTDTSFLTAYANDDGFEGVFERQVQALGRPGDVLLGISTSGSSKNVLRAIKCAQSLGIKSIALLGHQGDLIRMADVSISVPSESTQFIQESHLAIIHILCSLIETPFAEQNCQSVGCMASAMGDLSSSVG